MCEYCENREPIISGCKMFQHGIVNPIVGINHGKLETATIVQTAYAPPFPPFIAEAEIRFCPMCGRKLEVE